MANGRNNKLAGQIGEYLVCAELARRGYLATPFAGNVPTFDVLATDGNFNTLPIQVKASRGKGWQTNALEWMNIEFDPASLKLNYKGPKLLSDSHLIYVCTSIANDKDRFFILNKGQLQSVIIGRFIPWLESHAWQRPKKPDSFHCDYDLKSLGIMKTIGSLSPNDSPSWPC